MRCRSWVEVTSSILMRIFVIFEPLRIQSGGVIFLLKHCETIMRYLLSKLLVSYWITGCDKNLHNSPRTKCGKKKLRPPSHDDIMIWKHFPRYWPFVLFTVFLLILFIKMNHRKLLENLPACSAPSLYLNNCWNIVNSSISNKFQWHLSKKPTSQSRKCIWRCRLGNGNFFLGLNVLMEWFQPHVLIIFI